jgi:hypothetical protein
MRALANQAPLSSLTVTRSTSLPAIAHFRHQLALYSSVTQKTQPSQASLVRRSRFTKQLMAMLSDDSGYGSSDGESFKSARSSVSIDEYEKNDAPIPLRLEFEDVEAYEHLQKQLVVDGVTRKEVNGATKLAALYGYEDSDVDNDLVRNLATIDCPRVPCQLETSDGRRYPPSHDVALSNYCFQMSFVKLVRHPDFTSLHDFANKTQSVAPAVRLACYFGENCESKKPYLTLIVDFHFNEHTENGQDSITGYTHRHATISFDAGRATCSGFNWIDSHAQLLDQEDRAVIDVLRSFTECGLRHQVKLHLTGRRIGDSAKEQLNKIRERLPSGSGPLLASIGNKDYASFGGDQHTLHTSEGGGTLSVPSQLMSGVAPHPMVPLSCENTFGSSREAAVQLAYSAQLAEWESSEALRLWSAVKHQARLHLNHEHPLLAVYFCMFDKLGGRLLGRDRDLQFRLPHDLGCKFIITDPNRENVKYVLKGILLGSNPGVEGPDEQPPNAVFRITSKSKGELLERFDSMLGLDFEVKIAPHFSSFTYNQQLLTVKQLQQPRNSRWNDILLNQRHDALQSVDPTAGVSPSDKAKADNWLRNWKPWNHEQLTVINGITSAKGGMELVMGPAGTGKSLLQLGIAIYFYMLGYHILALAPANDNANKLAKDLLEIKDELPFDLNFNRLFPGSRDIPVDEMSHRQAIFREAGHEGGAALPFRELLNKLEESSKPTEAYREYGIIESMIRIAQDRSMKLNKTLREGSVMISSTVDAWDLVRQMISEWRDGTIDLNDHKQMEKYRVAYQGCKGQVVGKNRFMITTTGNVRSSEMLNYWFNPEHEYKVPRKGVVVLVDEAAKDVELNVWSGIVCEKWAESVKGVWLFGDDKYVKLTMYHHDHSANIQTGSSNRRTLQPKARFSSTSSPIGSTSHYQTGWCKKGFHAIDF